MAINYNPGPGGVALSGFQGAIQEEIDAQAATLQAGVDANGASVGELTKLALCADDRPGDNLGSFSAETAGAAPDRAALVSASVVNNDLGNVCSLTGAGLVFLRGPIAISRDVWEITARVRRETDPADPSNHAVQLLAVWLDRNKQVLGEEAILAQNPALLVSEGLVDLSERVSARIGTSGVVAPPAGAVYATVGIRQYGEDGVLTVETIRAKEVTDSHLSEPSDLSQLVTDAQAATAAASAAAATLDATSADGWADVAVGSFDTASVLGVRYGSALGDGLGGMWVKDAGDTTSAHQPPMVLVDSSGNRFKWTSYKVDSFATLDLISYDHVSAGAEIRLGSYRYVVAASGATDQHITTAGGVKLYVQSQDWGLEFGAFSPAHDGAISENPTPSEVFENYTVSGTDDGAKLNAAIAGAVSGKIGTLQVPHGQFYADTPLVMDAAAGNAARGLTIRGAGNSSLGHDQYGFGRQGSSIFLETGVGISGFQQGMSLQDVAIYGQTTGTLLDVGEGFVDGGGLSGATIINATFGASYDNSVAVQVSAFYTGAIRDSLIIGRRDFRAAKDDDSIHTSDLYFGTGLHCDTTGQGGIGQIDNTSISGFERGMVIEADEVSSVKRIAHTKFAEAQFSYCRTGVWLGQGVESIALQDPFFEWNTDQHVKFYNGAGMLRIKEGRSGGSERSYDDGTGAVTHRMKNAGFVFGDSDTSKCAWGGATISGHEFTVLSNMNGAVMLHAGTGAGWVILEDCVFGGGGTVALIDMTNSADGVPDVWIKNGSEGVTLGNFPSESRWICTFTRNGDYGLHSYTDANWFGRIEGVSVQIGAGGESKAALDFTGRRFVPYGIEPYLGTDLTITLSDRVWTAQDMRINKRYAAGALSVVVPSGVALYHDDGAYTRTAGSATVTVAASGAGNWVLEKLSGTEWTLRKVF